MAVLMPVILLLTFLGVQYSAYYIARSVALAAAQEATTAARAYDGPACEVAEERGRAFVARFEWLVEPKVETTCTGTDVPTVVSGVAISVIPGLRWEIRQVAHGPKERFTTEGAP